MAYSVLRLVTGAYYLSGLVSRRLQIVNGQQRSDGIDLLNDLLSEKNTDTHLIPYFKEHNLTAVINQEGYYIENLLYIETLTFNIGTVRYSMQKAGRKSYFGSNRVDNISSLPWTYHLERELGGARLFIYFLPSSAYPLKIWGKFGLDNVSGDEDLSLTYDRWYINYLRYALGKYICDENAITFPEQPSAKLESMEAKLRDLSPIDLQTQKMSSMQRIDGINWAYVNFPGWSP